MKIIQQSAELTSITSNVLALLERCGRVCYKSENKMACDNDKCHGGKIWNHPANEYSDCGVCKERSVVFLQNIIKHGHESVLEHANASVVLITDRGISHEIVRHRICAYSQESTRYCNYASDSGEITVIEPSNLPTDKAWKHWQYSCNCAEKAYIELLKEEASPQWARSVLPTCLKTELAMTANFREWRLILKNRALNRGAHPQIRELMKLVLDELMKTDAAFIFQDILDEWENEFSTKGENDE